MSCMGLIKLHKANETGQEVGVVFVSTDQGVKNTLRIENVRRGKYCGKVSHAVLSESVYLSGS